MADFKVISAALTDVEDRLDNLSRELSNSEDEIRRVSSQLSFKVSAVGALRLKLNIIANNAESCSRKMRKMSSAAGKISVKYNNTEQRILDKSEGNIGWIDQIMPKFPKIIRDWIDNIVDPHWHLNLFDKLKDQWEVIYPDVHVIGNTVGGAIDILHHAAQWYDSLDTDGTNFVDALTATGGIGAFMAGIIGLNTNASNSTTTTSDFLTATGTADASMTFDPFGRDISGKASAEGEAHLYQGSISGDYTYGNFDGELNVGNAAAQGEVGFSIFNEDGEIDPSLYANASAEVSVLEGSFNGQLGGENANIFLDAEGKLLAAEASAEAGVGKFTSTDEHGNTVTEYGVKAEFEAEAYIAEGTVSTGFNFMGIEIDVDLTGKAGGIGVAGGAEATTGGFEGNIGLGLGLGLEIGLDIDWSGFELKWPW
ncbi:MAG: hypothetical protein II998_09855 [Clostridia bacterium]|nr:hypothetical protein [Clostridia bacterium]